MRPAPLRPPVTASTAAVAVPAQPQRYLTNDEAAEYLRLSPRTLEKRGVGQPFRERLPLHVAISAAAGVPRPRCGFAVREPAL
ncbi:hypothetical protein L7Q46_005080 [Serratia marcescens]|nr:hypothetical protein [Serratia marcescens]EIV2915685.1 hypothetical protein [Serratia marcescens]